MIYADILSSIDQAENILERILEKDPRTFANQECEDSAVFDHVHTALTELKNAELIVLKKEFWK